MGMIELLGLLLPPLIDVINTKVNSSGLRFWVSVLVCVVLGSVLHILQNNGIGSQDELAQSIMVVFGLAQLSYKGFYEESSIRKSLTGEEN